MDNKHNSLNKTAQYELPICSKDKTRSKQSFENSFQKQNHSYTW